MSTMMQAMEDLNNAMVARARLLERAKRALHEDDLQGAIVDVIACLEHVQSHEEKLMRLHAECHGLIGYCGKVLEAEAQRRPIAFRTERVVAKPAAFPVGAIRELSNGEIGIVERDADGPYIRWGTCTVCPHGVLDGYPDKTAPWMCKNYERDDHKLHAPCEEKTP